MSSLLCFKRFKLMKNKNMNALEMLLLLLFCPNLFPVVVQRFYSWKKN